jgi:transposase-like protein
MARPIRYTPGRKAEIIQKALDGERATVLCEHDITDEELDRWIELYRAHGVKGLRSGYVQLYRAEDG